jgi:hypothetical protein
MGAWTRSVSRRRLTLAAMDWVTISSLATAGGTLVLAVATFASVRSGNRAARLAEQSLLTATRPLLMPSRLQDDQQKVGFQDQKWFVVDGGTGIAEVGDGAIYLAMSVRNVGNGIAVMDGWCFYPERRLGDDDQPPLDSFTRLTRDLYVAAGDLGFWQGTFRDPARPDFAAARSALEKRDSVMVDVLYGDEYGGQRVITRFSMTPRDDGRWTVSVSKHWHLDRPNPRG